MRHTNQRMKVIIIGLGAYSLVRALAEESILRHSKGVFDISFKEADEVHTLADAIKARRAGMTHTHYKLTAPEVFEYKLKDLKQNEHPFAHFIKKRGKNRRY